MDAIELVKDGTMSVQEATRFTGLSRSFLYEAMARGELAYVKIGNARRIPRQALELWLARHLVTGRRAEAERGA